MKGRKWASECEEEDVACDQWACEYECECEEEWKLCTFS